MNFQTLQKIEKVDFYLDLAFSNAKKIASTVRGGVKGERLRKSKKIELKRIMQVKKELDTAFNRIIKSFPCFEDLHLFYQELISLYFSIDQIRKSLGALRWALKKVNDFLKLYSRKIKMCQNITEINKIRNQFYGRVASILRQIKKDLLFLENCRKTLKNFPTIKTKLPTVAITGFPNVGKTTLLFKLTKSKPEIASYPFTTKSLNLGYLKTKLKQKKKKEPKIQLIDTPGTLNRFNKMNTIEKQAYLALKYVSQMVVYMFDLTEPYPLKKQVQLYGKIRKDFQRPMVVYLSKTDILDKKIVDGFKKKLKTKVFTDPKQLKKRLLEEIQISEKFEIPQN